MLIEIRNSGLGLHLLIFKVVSYIGRALHFRLLGRKIVEKLFIIIVEVLDDIC